MKLYLTILLIATSLITNAQNLVPNPGFENLNYCPAHHNDYAATQNWYTAQQNSPDFYHTCITYMGGVPYNFLGYQQPFAGNGYAGVVLYLTQGIEYREYIGTKLTQKLQPTKTYCVSFYVSAADSAGLQVSSIGAYIGDSIYDPLQVSHLPYTPQIQNAANNYIENNTGWQLIQGTFVAEGNEEYLTIGNFYSDVNTPLGPNSAVPHQYPNQYYIQSYVYIDNVSLYLCDGLAIDESAINNQIKLYPNPAVGFITLETPVTYTELQLQLYSLTGALVHQSVIKGGV